MRCYTEIKSANELVRLFQTENVSTHLFTHHVEIKMTVSSGFGQLTAKTPVIFFQSYTNT